MPGLPVTGYGQGQDYQGPPACVLPDCERSRSGRHADRHDDERHFYETINPVILLKEATTVDAM